MERRKKKGRNRLHVVRLSVTSTYFRFHVVFVAHIPRTDMHRTQLLHSWFSLCLFHLPYVVIVVFVYIYNI